VPIYKYQCKECEYTFEEFHPMSETIEECPKCASAVRRLLPKGRVTRKSLPTGNNKPGKIVKQYIEDVKQEVKQEKKRILSQEYKPE
jgi:putative FmdB family regulatory protein